VNGTGDDTCTSRVRNRDKTKSDGDLDGALCQHDHVSLRLSLSVSVSRRHVPAPRTRCARMDKAALDNLIFAIDVIVANVPERVLATSHKSCSLCRRLLAALLLA